MDWKQFATDLTAAVARLGVPEYAELDAQIKKTMQHLVDSHGIAFGPDHSLGGRALELRVHILLRDLGWTIAEGSRDREDGVIVPPPYVKTAKPIVYEVKSASKAPGPGRDELRQLDDWDHRSVLVCWPSHVQR